MLIYSPEFTVLVEAKMKERPSAEELQEYVLDAIAACWINLRGVKEGIVFDTFEELLRVLKGHMLSWAGLGALNLIDVTWSDEKMWKSLRSRFGAVENPWGVMNFAKEQIAAAKQRRDYLGQMFPRMVEFIDNKLPELYLTV
jgi:hypothetical protein